MTLVAISDDATAAALDNRTLPNFPAHMHPADRFEATLRVACAHLEKVLNGCRSHAEQQAADKAAREFLSGVEFT